MEKKTRTGKTFKKVVEKIMQVLYEISTSELKISTIEAFGLMHQIYKTERST